MLNAFSRDIRSVRAQENIGVHLGTPFLVQHFPEKSDPYLSSNRRRPSTADVEAHSWIKERPVVAPFASAVMSDLSPECVAKADVVDHSEFMGSRPRQKRRSSRPPQSPHAAPRLVDDRPER